MYGVEKKRPRRSAVYIARDSIKHCHAQMAQGIAAVILTQFLVIKMAHWST